MRFATASTSTSLSGATRKSPKRFRGCSLAHDLEGSAGAGAAASAETRRLLARSDASHGRPPCRLRKTPNGHRPLLSRVSRSSIAPDVPHTRARSCRTFPTSRACALAPQRADLFCARRPSAPSRSLGTDPASPPHQSEDLAPGAAVPKRLTLRSPRCQAGPRSSSCRA